MTVGELIIELQKLDPALDVEVYHAHEDYDVATSVTVEDGVVRIDSFE